MKVIVKRAGKLTSFQLSPEDTAEEDVLRELQNFFAMSGIQQITTQPLVYMCRDVMLCVAPKPIDRTD